MEYAAEIRKIAWVLFSTNGIKATSIEAICKELKISKKTFYKYYKNKEDLLLSIFTDKKDSLYKIFEQGVKDKQSPIEIFIKILLHLRIIFHQNNSKSLEDKTFLPIQQSIIVELSTIYPHVWEVIDDFRHKLVERIAAMLEQEKDEYIKENINTRVISTMLFGILDNIVQPEFLEKNNVTPIEAIDSVFTVLFTGMVRDEKHQELMQLISLQN